MDTGTGTNEEALTPQLSVSTWARSRTRARQVTATNPKILSADGRYRRWTAHVGRDH
jgi:hypothetical protein